MAKIKTELASYKEQVELFKIEQIPKNNGFLDESLTAGKSNLFYNTQKEEEQGKGTIRDVVENISDSYFEKMEIIKGELLINTKDNNEIKIAKELGIKVNPYDIDENGVLLSTGNNLALMDENGTVTIPDNVTEIGEGAFANEGLKTIIIPGTVKKIQANAFAYNSTLETVIMQEGVEEIGEEAFRNCSNLKNVTLPQSLIIMKRYSFLYCDSLQQVSIPEKVENIELRTFNGCYSLNKVELSEGLKKIGEGAFRDTSFSEIIIPSTVETIGNNIFFGNTKLNKITVNEKDGEVIVFQIQKSDIATYPIIQGIAESYKFSMGTVTYLDAFFQDIIEQPYFREQISTVKEFENGGAWVAECCQNLIIVRASEVATRQKMQQGRFILFPNKIKKDSSGKFYFEKIIEPIEKSDDEVKKVFCIPKEIKKELLTKLEILGISEATLFSDSIDMVCKGIVEECQRRL